MISWDIEIALQNHHLKKAYLAYRKLFLKLLFKNHPNKRGPALNDSPKAILVVAPPRIGDIALALPVFHALRENFPATKIDVVAKSYVSDVLSLIRKVDLVMKAADSITERYRQLSQLRRSEYDVAIDLNFDYHLFPALVAGLAGAFSIGYDYAGRGFIFNKKLPLPEREKHVVHIFLEPLRQLIPAIRVINPRIDVQEQLASETEKLLSENGISAKDRLILVHPGAHHPTQRWSPKYFAETADKIIEAGMAKLVFMGGPEDKNLLRHIQSLMGQRPDGAFLGLAVKNLIGLIDRADLMVCNNSGPLHLSVATSTATVSTMGPTLRERWMPIGHIHKVLRRDDLPCIGCNLGFCKIGSHDCMRLITPSMVFAAVEDLLPV